ncbi:PCNA-associated factor-like isoform X2 [Aricia agestis]|uniref:PCNA-associated factor-like isoform X2 n=1 Tax=Aricia agestis TaxID=91739 RepID=UPI001C207718|nr:PCNA-associated factor-like isoform X2 [Aricia agestis]
MARTKASVGAKVSSGKSSKARCSVAPQTVNLGSSGREKSSRSSSGGNPVCPRETPKWQKPITTFFVANQTKDSDADENEIAGSSKSKPKRNVILSDNEDDTEDEKPVNTALDETIELEPLTGENSHKIEEYYEKKGKGQGKKSNKENVDANKQSNKRDLDDVEETQVIKKRKVA